MPPGGVVGVELLVDRVDQALDQRGQRRGGLVDRADILRAEADELGDVAEPIFEVTLQARLVNPTHLLISRPSGLLRDPSCD